MKNNKTAKFGILVVVLLLTVAFAAVTTTLNIGGTASIGSVGTDLEENVTFATGEDAPYLMVNGVKQTTSTVTLSDDKKTINFTAPKFSNKGDNAELHYKVTNDSTNYAAKLSALNCSAKATGTADVSYLKMTYGTAHDDLKVETGSTTAVDNTVLIELAKTYVGEDEPTYSITCTINATGVEK